MIIEMVNIKKISHQILNDGLYNTLLYEMGEELKNKNPSQLELEELLNTNPVYIADYKEINRHSEISSVQVKELELKLSDAEEVKDTKQRINENVQKLKNLENFEVDSKNSAYSIWIGSAGVMVLFMAHNIIALFTELYNTNHTSVYLGYAFILYVTYLAYKKMKNLHEEKHAVYMNKYQLTKELIKVGLATKVFTYEELYVK